MKIVLTGKKFASAPERVPLLRFMTQFGVQVGPGQGVLENVVHLAAGDMHAAGGGHGRELDGAVRVQPSEAAPYAGRWRRARLVGVDGGKDFHLAREKVDAQVHDGRLVFEPVLLEEPTELGQVHFEPVSVQEWGDVTLGHGRCQLRAGDGRLREKQ